MTDPERTDSRPQNGMLSWDMSRCAECDGWSYMATVASDGLCFGCGSLKRLLEEEHDPFIEG